MIELLVIVFLVTMFAGVPLAFCTLLGSIAFIWSTGRLPYEVVPQQVFHGLDHFTFLAIPMFVLAGELMNHGGITRRLIACVQAFVGHFRGGLAYVSVVTNMLMAGISGSALADAAGTGSVLIPSMKRAGYPASFGAAVISAASTIGPVIPPSIPFILYATIAGVSVGKMFAAGALPGLFMGIGFLALVGYLGQVSDFPKDRRSTLREMARSFVDAGLALVMPLIILGGILFGVFTATEAASIAVVYALVIAMGVYREVRFRDLGRILYETGISSAVIMFVIGAAGLLSWVINFSQVAQHLSVFLSGLEVAPSMLLLMMAILLIFLGCFMEASPLIIIMTPVLLPAATAAGIDPVHFGLVMVLTLMIGLITPPVGMVLFITAGIGQIGMIQVARACLPFILVILLVMLLAIFVPAWVMWLPNMV